MRFRHVPHPTPRSSEDRAALLAEPGFGRVFSDHMVTITWTAARGWHDATVGPYGPLPIDPAAAALHHGASIFEGLKVYRRVDGTLVAFRPDLNAARLRRSAARLALPELPEDLFLAALDELLAVDHAWVPAAGGEDALYLRPLLFSPAAGLRPEPGDEALFVVIASPAGAYFRDGLSPVRAWLGSDQVRAWPGGTGAAKAGVNYAASLAAQAEPGRTGATRWSGSTRRTGAGSSARSRPASGSTARDGSLREVFASGTAAVITPVGAVVDHDGATAVADGRPGPVTTALRERLTGIQQGRHDDRHGWLRVLRSA